MPRKLPRLILKTLLILVSLVVLFTVLATGPVDRSAADEHPSYVEMMNRLQALDSLRVPEPKHGFRVGFATVNLTPYTRTATAGYGNRKGRPFTAILDSIYVRALVIDNGAQKAAIVSADLLIIPPTVTARLEGQLPSIGFSLDNTFLGATHTHNSIGNWGEGATRFLYGKYEEAVVDFIADKIVECIWKADAQLVESRVDFGAVAVPQAVDNRLIDGGPEDSLMRVIEIHREDSARLLLMSYSAHATCLFSRDVVLSRDYPGKLVDTMEANGYTFAMFLAGAVGSHGCSPPEFGEPCIDWMASEISSAVLAARQSFAAMADSSLCAIRIPLLLGDPQVKIGPGWKVRSWLFRAAFGEYPAYLTGLRFGDAVMLGTPCDYSGEFHAPLDSTAARYGLFAIATSFNGGYIGYVTPRKYYDVDHYETQLMNWYAPGTGEYVSKALQKVIGVLAE